VTALPPNKLAYSIPEAEDATSLKKDAFYEAIRLGKLKAKKYGQRTLLLRPDLEAFLADLPAMKSAVKHAA
jgi:hypothetical protein